MARGTQLAELIDQLRSNLEMSVNPAQGVNALGVHKRALNEAQELMYYAYEWPFLNGYFDVTMSAGSQFYDLPVDPGTIERVEFKWGNVWTPLVKGIGGPQLNAQDSDNDQRSDPVQNWEFYQTNQFRVFPIPASGDGIVRFYGRQALSRLVTNTDRAVLDDTLIVKFAAAQLSPDKKKASKQQEANTFFNVLKKRYRNRKRVFVLGGGGGQPVGRQPPGHVRVAEANRSGS
jgi:hypothetical protein